MFYGTPVFIIPQRHRIGTTTFAMDDNIITVLAGDEKIIKFVWEGTPLIIPGNPIDNVDLTQEWFYTNKYGMAIVTAGDNSGIGRYQISTQPAPTL